MRHIIELPAVPPPHLGSSYNPPVNAYQELLLKANDEEEKRIAKEAKIAEIKKRMDQAVDIHGLNGAPGMAIDTPQDQPSVAYEGSSAELAMPKSQPERKTSKQRRKAERNIAEVRTLSS